MGTIGFGSLFLLNVLLSDRPEIQVETHLENPVSVEAIEQSARQTPNLEPSARRQQQEVLDKLRVQSALRAAKDCMAQQKFTDAIAHLEPCLDTTVAHSDVLTLLEQCYRGRIAELVAQGESHDASLLAERLRAMGQSFTGQARELVEGVKSASQRVVDETSALTKPAALTLQKPVQAASKLGRQMVDSMKSMIPHAQPAETLQVRAKLDDSEPLVAETVIDRALVLFRDKRYAEALAAFEQAAADPSINIAAHEVRWGYCLLHVTIKKYNQLLDQDWKAAAPEVWEELKSDAVKAQRLAPKINYCDKVIRALEERIQDSKNRQGATSQTQAPVENTQAYGLVSQQTLEPADFVQHRPTGSANWQIAETRNFVIYHRDPALAEEMGARAEQARQYAIELWFANDPVADWIPKCELYLYPTSQEYSMATGVPGESPGHSKVLNDRGTIQARQVFLRMDDRDARMAVLPHEVAHVVFAGRFGAATVPRWADEGMAVLTEPVDKQNAHLSNLARCYASGMGYSCAQIMTMGEYPPGERMRDFYAHSVGVCRSIVEKHGHAALILFLRRSLETGNYEGALRETLGMESFSQLETDFRQFIGGIGSTRLAVNR